jgi:hypothetical protein
VRFRAVPGFEEQKKMFLALPEYEPRHCGQYSVTIPPVYVAWYRMPLSSAPIIIIVIKVSHATKRTILTESQNMDKSEEWCLLGCYAVWLL